MLVNHYLLHCTETVVQYLGRNFELFPLAFRSSGFSMTHLDVNQVTEENGENCLYKNHPQ